MALADSQAAVGGVHEHSAEFQRAFHLGGCRHRGVHDSDTHAGAFVQGGDDEFGMVHALVPAGIGRVAKCGQGIALGALGRGVRQGVLNGWKHWERSSK